MTPCDTVGLCGCRRAAVLRDGAADGLLLPGRRGGGPGSARGCGARVLPGTDAAPAVHAAGPSMMPEAAA